MTTRPRQFVPDIRLIDAVDAIRKRYRFVLALTAAIFAVLSVFILTEAPVYRAYVTLAPSTPLTDPSPLSIAEEMLGVPNFGGSAVFQAQASARNAFALLRSKAISRRFIEAYNLMPVLFADEWDAEKQAWRETNHARQPTIGDALELLEREVRFISRNEATGFIRVNIEWSDPEVAADWANQLVAMTDHLIRERDIEEARQNIRYLEELARDAPIESVKQLMYKLIESHAKRIMVDSIKDDYVFTVIDPAVSPEAGDTINMPVSFKLSLALILALGCSISWAILASELAGKAD